MSTLVKRLFSKVALFNIKNRFIGFEVDKNPFGESVDLKIIDFKSNDLRNDDK